MNTKNQVFPEYLNNRNENDTAGEFFQIFESFFFKKKVLFNNRTFGESCVLDSTQVPCYLDNNTAPDCNSNQSLFSVRNYEIKVFVTILNEKFVFVFFENT